jgi:branched-chain amino acid transport system permease protein
MSYVGLVLFGIVAVLIVNLRHSTTGLALGAVRSSEPGAKTLGIPVLRMKAILIGLAACVAGIGGGLLAVVNGAAVPDDFATLAGVVWLAVLVTAGIRSNMAALIAGMMFAIVPGLVLVYLPASWNQLPPILFGLGAIALAKNPEGFVLQNGRALRAVAARWLNGGSRAPGARVTAATVDTVDPTPGRTKPHLIESDGRP